MDWQGGSDPLTRCGLPLIPAVDMEPPPPDQCDGLHPQQDFAQCSIPVVYDLSIKHRDGPHKNSTMEALHMRNKPNWYNKEVFQENSSDHPAHQSDQIQPDDAFSNTTVTLSYVSRSHMFSSHQNMSRSLHKQLPPLCVPAVNRKLSLHSLHEGNTLVSSQCEKEVDHHENHLVQNIIKPSGGAQSSTQSLHQRESFGPNGKQATCQLNVIGLHLQHAGANSETKSFHDRNEDIHIQNGTDNCLPDKWSCKSIKKTTWAPVDFKKESKLAESQMRVVCSGTEEPVDLNSSSCSNKSFIPINGECNGPSHEDTLASPATSQDKTGDTSVVQTLNTPFSKYDLQEADANAKSVCDLKLKPGEPSEAPAFAEATTVCVKVGDSVQEHCSKHTAAAANMSDYSTEMLKPSSSPSPTSTENNAKTDVTQYTESKASDVCLPNCNAGLGEKTIERKILPPRSRRGIRLEEIVQCITPSRTRGKSAGSKTQALETSRREALVSSKVEDCIEKSSSHGNEDGRLKDSVISKEDSDKVGKERLKNKNSTADEGTSDASTSLQSSTSLEAVLHTPKHLKEKTLCDKEVIGLSPPEKKNLRPASTPKSCQNSSASPQKDSPVNNKYAETKKPSMNKRKRKKHNAGLSSVFSPKEPEIKLKYVNYKEEKRDNKMDTFSPYVRLELKDSMCTIINYPEEEKAKLKGKNSSQATQCYSSGAVPMTSCLLLGRLSSDSRRRSHLVCCLCGRSANAMDLGDLHGPYYPEGFKPSGKKHANVQILKDNDNDSNSDSSCSVKEKKHSQTVTAGESPSRLSQHSRASMKEACLIGQRRRWSSAGSGTGSPVPKKPKTDPTADDWYSPPIVPLDSSEYWIHEDCAIWCAGVYLVKGKLHGLAEATKLAQETVCSTCHTTGATLGCYFKGCPNKYHYSCAIQSDCVLSEDNFSMRCTKHKVGVVLYSHSNSLSL
ncbi:transcription factor 20-like isoform X2 [Acipenser ruthenus]|uniref:transcription factor 20-like isoform X2 n=1 Tax=Acipenser ruthenus TaxID=7906 RepID=UPI002740B51C|nr:transcription factor 20-like isoform X2 [Acipenser ruthenus]XP_058845890.1 transcription factor 20-like isoform X2 [Acipenser ruthenus]